MNPYVYHDSLQHTAVPDLLYCQGKDEMTFLTIANLLHKQQTCNGPNSDSGVPLLLNSITGCHRALYYNMQHVSVALRHAAYSLVRRNILYQKTPNIYL